MIFKKNQKINTSKRISILASTVLLCGAVGLMTGEFRSALRAFLRPVYWESVVAIVIVIPVILFRLHLLYRKDLKAGYILWKPLLWQTCSFIIAWFAYGIIDSLASEGWPRNVSSLHLSRGLRVATVFAVISSFLGGVALIELNRRLRNQEALPKKSEE